MFYANLQNRNHVNGFSLIEVMVGMTLGLLTVIIIMQVFSVFENQKRTTTAGSDAQANGMMAMVQLEQELRSAGNGLLNADIFNCSTINSYYDSGVSGSTPVSPAPGMPTSSTGIAPVTITDGGASGSDTITMRKASEFLGSIPATITSAMPQPSAELNVSRTEGFAIGQKIIVMSGNNCTVMEVSAIQGSAFKVQHNPANSGPSYNPPGSFYTSVPGNAWPTFPQGSQVLDFGSIVTNTYSIDADLNLQLAAGTASGVPLVKDIVRMKALYGVSSAAGIQAVNQWVDATTYGTLDTDKIKRIKAIQITIVARSGKKEATNVTTTAPGGVSVSYLTDWQKYRYRVYTTIIPLRNVIWANV